MDLGQVKSPNRKFQINVFVKSQIIKVEIPNTVDWLIFLIYIFLFQKSNMSHYISPPQNEIILHVLSA